MDIIPNQEMFLGRFIPWYNANMKNNDEPNLENSEVHIVWYCRTLDNAKCLIETSRDDHMYFELTYDGYKAKVYIDTYIKLHNNTLMF